MEPWIASSPLLRTPVAKPEGVEKAAEKSGKGSQQKPLDGSAGQHLMQIVKDLHGVPQEAKEAIQKAIVDNTADANSPVRHAHLYRVENLKRTVDKFQSKLQDLDVEWASFTERMKEKFAVQRKAYLASREQISKALAEKSQQLDEAMSDLKRRAALQKGPVIDLEQQGETGEAIYPWDMELDLSTPPEAAADDTTKTASPQNKKAKLEKWERQ